VLGERKVAVVTPPHGCYPLFVLRRDHHRPNRGRRVYALLVVLSAMGGCKGKLITLGVANSGASGELGDAGTASGIAGRPTGVGGDTGIGGSVGGGSTEPIFGDVTVVEGLASEYKDDNPTLTSNLCEIYFSSNRPGGSGDVDVWMSRRDSSDEAFGAPVPVAAANTQGFESSPAISGDGLTLWVGLEADAGLGGLDIWQLVRLNTTSDFANRQLVLELSSDADDIPRPLGNHGLTMPLGSRRDGGMYYTYLSTRDSTASVFATPVRTGELEADGYNVSDGFLTEDGLSIYFARAIDSRGDLFFATRTHTSDPFGTPIALSSLNGEDTDERDPWLSPDGTRLYFATDRDGLLGIYEAQRQK
jgi:hypothetical protein